MIVTKLQGGHSNQLFQYATGRALAARHGVELVMDVRWFDAIAEGDTRRAFELEQYSLDQNLVDGRSLALRESTSRAFPLRGLLPRASRRGPTLVPYRQLGNGYDPRVLSLPDNSYLEGWWQDERYFSEIRATLLAELQLRSSVNGRNAEVLRQIRNGASVSMHVRRGDYVTNPAATSFHGVLGIGYYEAALEELSRRTGLREPNLFVFSDDIEWCKRHLRIPQRMHFVDGANSGAEDMHLMRHCDHHIVANSSFSWWGAWLGEHPAKVVVAPKRWFKDHDANTETGIVPPSWVRL